MSALPEAFVRSLEVLGPAADGLAEACAAAPR